MYVHMTQLYYYLPISKSEKLFLSKRAVFYLSKNWRGLVCPSHTVPTLRSALIVESSNISTLKMRKYGFSHSLQSMSQFVVEDMLIVFLFV